MEKVLSPKQRVLASIDWQHQDKSTLIEWLQSGCPNNLKEVNKSFKPILIGASIFAIILTGILSVAATNLIDLIVFILIVCFFFVPITSLIYLELRGSRIYCYRITKVGIEIASWKSILEQVKKGLNVLFIVIFLALIPVFITDPSAILVGLGGMVGVAVIYGGVVFSDSFATRTRAATQFMYQWQGELSAKRYKCIVIDRKLKLIVIDQEPSQCTVKGYERKNNGILLFCTKSNIDQVAELLKEYLPHLPQIEGSARLTPQYIIP